MTLSELLGELSGVAPLLEGAVGASEVVVAIAWATVDLERTREQAGITVDETRHDEILGGVASIVTGGSVSVVVIEPDTEGRAAAFLARHGEGVCAVYVEKLNVDGSQRLTALGRNGRLRPIHERWGPFVIELRAADRA